MSPSFVSAVVRPEHPSESAWWFAFQGGDLLVVEDGSVASVPCLRDLVDTGLADESCHYLGRLRGVDCFAAALAEGAACPEGAGFHGLRSLYGRLDDDLFALAGRAFQIVEWDRTHRFCGRCGARTEDVEGERAKRCPSCEHLSFPRLSPAVIVLVRRGQEVLLARGRSFVGPFYSALAGFVEPGESLEEAVVREVREEVGLAVTDLRYFGSQSWPFPHSLMIGFTAEYAGGEIAIDEEEIVDAGWFSVERLPPLPGRLSIARALIEAFLAERGLVSRAPGA